MKRVAVLQSNYLPWRGYFDIIHDVDLFIFYDDIQYTKGDWRNRNKIVTPSGVQWLTVPCGTNIHRLVIDVQLNNEKWQKLHYTKICLTYKDSPYFSLYNDFLKDIYLGTTWNYLYELNRHLIMMISHEFLDVTTIFEDSRNFETHGVKQEKLLSLLESVGCTRYISGPAAKSYIIEEDYRKAGIEIIWKDYTGYPAYKQIREPFEPNVSILDLLFNTGPDAPWYIWGWRSEQITSEDIE